MQNERKVLVSAILKAEKSGYSNIILNNVLKESDLDQQKKAFVTAGFYGVLERKLTLDYILNKYLKRPIKKAPPYTAAVLRSGTYQILFMEKVPDSAAVNESVKLIKKSKEQGNSSLVNAVLRKVAEDNSLNNINILSPDVKYSVENWIYNRLETDYGKEKTETFLENSLKAPPVFVKLNTVISAEEKIISAAERESVKLQKTSLPGTYLVSGAANIENTEIFKSGLIYVQDFSSSFCAAAVNVKPGMRVLDCCAAPGGKTFSIALNMEDMGEIIACDLHLHRVGLIEKGAERLGLESIKPFVMNSTEYNKDLGLFDRVLCDVPCSGIGVIRRKPEIKYKNEAECNELPSLQLKILSNAKNYVKPGGRLIYSTCTLLKAENQEVINRFLSENKDFFPAPIDVMDVEESSFTLIPPEYPGDGFFVAAMERK